MKDVRKPASVRLAAVVSALALAALPLCSMAQQEHAPAAGHMDSMHEHMREHMQEHMQARIQEHLDKLAARLEIRASQQEAWSGFAGAVKGMVPAMPHEPPSKDLDAAARARMAADRAGEHARKLAQLADATAKLQKVLDGNQQQVLNEVARHLGHHGHGHGDGHDGMHEGMHEHGHEDGHGHEEH